MSLELESYNYYLPQNLIAKEPIFPKQNARLLVYEKKSGKISHLYFRDLAEVLPSCNIIFNDTKVIKARIFGQKQSGAKIQMLLNQPLGDCNFSCFIKGSVKPGQILLFDDGLKACVKELKNDGSRVVSLSKNDKILNADELFKILEKIGHIPLPPYIKRDDIKNDELWYQSIFAKNQGAVAAPTASLHFDDDLLLNLHKKYKIAYITLHVGAGTFKSVETQNILEHKMHSEFYNISEQASKFILSDEPLLAVGTTVARSIEYFAKSKQKSGMCDIFLHLQNPPKRVNFLLTNFHLPKSTLIMLVSSFIGLENTIKIYKIAIEKQYRFYSYGDAMLII